MLGRVQVMSWVAWPEFLLLRHALIEIWCLRPLDKLIYVFLVERGRCRYSLHFDRACINRAIMLLVNCSVFFVARQILDHASWEFSVLIYAFNEHVRDLFLLGLVGGWLAQVLHEGYVRGWKSGALVFHGQVVTAACLEFHPFLGVVHHIFLILLLSGLEFVVVAIGYVLDCFNFESLRHLLEYVAGPYFDWFIFVRNYVRIDPEHSCFIVEIAFALFPWQLWLGLTLCGRVDCAEVGRIVGLRVSMRFDHSHLALLALDIRGKLLWVLDLLDLPLESYFQWSFFARHCPHLCSARTLSELPAQYCFAACFSRASSCMIMVFSMNCLLKLPCKHLTPLSFLWSYVTD